MNINILEVAFKLLFIGFFLASLIFYALLILSAKRAFTQTQVPLPSSIRRTLIAILIFLIGSLLFIIFS
ncbi:MAG: hypothetical protein WD967_01490, partial [Candidatus Levyibacteriota bacterium]